MNKEAEKVAKDALLQVRISPELKQSAEDAFSSLGLTTSEAVRLFLTKSVQEQRLPFELSSERPSGKLEAFGALNIFASPSKRDQERGAWISSLNEKGGQ